MTQYELVKGKDWSTRTYQPPNGNSYEVEFEVYDSEKDETYYHYIPLEELKEIVILAYEFMHDMDMKFVEYEKE